MKMFSIFEQSVMNNAKAVLKKKGGELLKGCLSPEIQFYKINGECICLYSGILYDLR